MALTAVFSKPVETVKDTAGDDTSWPAILEALKGLEFGSVTIIVQDGLVVQIDRTEKRRLRRKENR